MALKDIVNISLLGFSVQKSILSSNVLLKWLSKKAWNRFCLAVFTLGRRLHVQNHWKQKGVLHCGPSKGPSWLFVVDLLVACSLSPVHLSPTVVWCGFIKTHGWAVAVVGWLLAALVGSLDKYLEGPRKRLHFSCVKAVPFLGPLICLKVAPGTQARAHVFAAATWVD